MEVIMKYYTEIDGAMQKYYYPYHPGLDNWLSDCHSQPILELTDMVFLDTEREKAWAICRRCGKYANFSNERFTW